MDGLFGCLRGRQFGVERLTNATPEPYRADLWPAGFIA